MASAAPLDDIMRQGRQAWQPSPVDLSLPEKMRAPPVRRLISVRQLAVVFEQFVKQLGESMHARQSSLEQRLTAVERRLANVRLRPATADERQKWAQYLAQLGGRAEKGEEVTTAQAAKAIDVWSRIVEFDPRVMYPTSGMHDDVLYFSWNPVGATLTVEIEPDGRVTWFFQQDEPAALDGSEEPETELPGRFFECLLLFFRA